MKARIKRSVSLIIVFILLLGAIQISLLNINAETSNTANIVSASIRYQDTTYCTSHGADFNSAKNWVITITADRNIGTNDGSYYWRHMQVHSDAGIKDAILNNISINGQSIKDCIAQAPDPHVAIHVKTSGKSLEIAIPDPNIYAFDGNENFTIGIKEGITINGYTLKVTDVVYNSTSKTFSIKTPSIAAVTSAEFLYRDSGYCTSNHGGAQYVIKLITDKNIGDNDGSYYWRHMQVHNDVEVKNNVLNKISVNGKTVNELIENAADKHTAIHIKTSGNVLEVAIPASNTYGFDGTKNFEVVLSEGITLGGYDILPVKAQYDTASGKFSFKDENTANIVSASIRYQDTTYCTSHGADFNSAKNWVITITADKNIGTNDGSYYWRHMQVHSDAGIKDAILNNISINGQGIKDCIAQAPDPHVAIHVKTSGKSLEIAIPETNIFGFDGKADFAVSITNGITLNGFNIDAVNIAYNAAEDKFTMGADISGDEGDGEEDKDPEDGGGEDNPENDSPYAKFISAAVTYSEGTYCGAHGNDFNNVANWVIKLKANKNIQFGDDSYFYRHLQIIEDEILRAYILNKIKINGTSVADCISSYSNKHIAIHIKAKGDTLEIAIPDNNTYGFDGNTDFDIEILSGITLGSVQLNPCVVKYSASTKLFAITQKQPAPAVDPNSASVLGGSITRKDSGYCSSHKEATWVIRLSTDKKIEAGDGNYYWRHMQVFTDEKIAAMVCEKLVINGKTVTELINNASNQHSALHIRASGTDIEIAIPLGNNFHFYGDSDFTIDVLSGLTLNDHPVNPVHVKFDAAFGRFNISELGEDGVAEDTSATVQSAELVNSQNGYCASHNTSDWVIRITTDQKIEMGDDSYYWRHMQAHNDTALKDMLIQNILINGKTLAELLTDVSDTHSALHIKTVDKTLEIAIPKSNNFGFDGNADFTVTVTNGIVLNGHILNSSVLIFKAAENKFVIDNRAVGNTDGFVTGVSLKVENEIYWVIELTVDKDITVSGSGSFDLQNINSQNTRARKDLANRITSLVTINGETLAESMERAGNVYTARVSATGNVLKLKLKRKTDTTGDNDFHISDKYDFTLGIKGVLTINNVNIQPKIWKYNAAKGIFVIYTGTDDKNLAEPIFSITGSEIGDNGKGIFLWSTGTSRVVRFLLDGRPLGTSHNAEAEGTLHGEQCRKYIYVDGMSISEWIAYGSGDLYQVMVRFKENQIEFLFDGSREPGMMEDEAHWIEIKDGLYTSAEEKIAPQKLYYDPETGKWNLVDSFDGLPKPWFVTDSEKRTQIALSGRKDNGEHFTLSVPKYNELSFDENGPKTNVEKVDGQKRQEPTYVYEYYMPWWAIVLICVGVATAVLIVVIILVKSKKKRNSL